MSFYKSLINETAGGDATFDNLTVTGNLQVDGTINTDESYLLDGDTLIDKPNTTSLRVGPLATAHSITGTNNTVINAAGHNLTSAANCTALGYGSLNANQTGNNNTALGYQALTLLTGASSVGIGEGAGNITTGGQSVFLGAKSGSLAPTADNQIAIGFESETTQANQCVIGNSDITQLKVADTELLNLDAAYPNSIGLGTGSTIPADNSCQIGNSSVNRLTFGGGTTEFSVYRPNSSSVSLGAFPTGAFTGDNNLVIKGDACRFTTAINNIAIGFGSCQYSLETTGALSIGRFALRDMQYNTDGLTDSVSGQAGIASDDNVAIGLNSLLKLQCGFYNVAVGASCFNKLIGVRPVPPLTTPATIRVRNTAVGRAAGIEHDGNDCTFLGYATGTTASSSFSNSTAIGNSAIIRASNQIRMGNGSVTALLPGGNDVMSLGDGSYRFTEVFATNGTINTSDRNNKDMIAETNLGLEFINDLKPVKYKWKDYSEEYEDNDYTDLDNIKYIKKSREHKFNRLHHGLIAQEVKESMDKFGVSSNDFAGYIDTKDAGLGLRYSEFIAPMIKAIQELTARVKELESLNSIV